MDGMIYPKGEMHYWAAKEAWDQANEDAYDPEVDDCPEPEEEAEDPYDGAFD